MPVNAYAKHEALHETVKKIVDSEIREEVKKLLEEVPDKFYEELKEIFDQGFVPLIEWTQFGKECQAVFACGRFFARSGDGI